MRGSDQWAGALFSYVDRDRRVRADHPPRVIRSIVNDGLVELSAEFEAMYAPGLSRPSILRNGCCGRCCCACLTQAGVHAERIAALHMTEPHAERSGRITIAADKGYDTEDLVNELRSMNVTPHVAAKARSSAVDGRTTRHASYKASQRVRKRIEEAFGWAKSAACARQAPQRRSGRLAVHLHHGRLQPHQVAETARRSHVTVNQRPESVQAPQPTRSGAEITRKHSELVDHW